MKALVTGAAGFIGSHLVERLLARGADVVGIDNLSTGSIQNLDEAVYSYGPQFMLLAGSVTAQLRRLKRQRFDALFHLAAHVGAKTVRADPFNLLADHALDILAVTRFAVRNQSSLVAISSSEVYGASMELPFKESQFVRVGPSSVSRWSYAVSKLQLEHVCLAAHKQYGLRCVVPRLFNVTGPRQRADTGMVLPTFARRALAGEPLVLHGDGSQRRCFSHVRDIASVIADLPDFDSANGCVINVGCADGRTMLSVARDVGEYVRRHYTGTTSEISFAAHDEQDATAEMPERLPDLTLLEKLTGLQVPSRWPELVAHVCDYWAAQMKIRKLA